jgi:hypothetical protein
MKFLAQQGWKIPRFRVIGAYLQSPARSARMNILLYVRLPAVMPSGAIFRR